MQKTRLGRTGLMVTRSSFGALPIQRISFDEAKKIGLGAGLTEKQLEKALVENPIKILKKRYLI